MNLEGVLIEDRKRDTLLYAGNLKVNITDWFFFKKNIELKYIGLDNAIIKFQRSDSIWRQQFIFDYFFFHNKRYCSKEKKRDNIESENSGAPKCNFC